MQGWWRRVSGTLCTGQLLNPNSGSSWVVFVGSLGENVDKHRVCATGRVQESKGAALTTVGGPPAQAVSVRHFTETVRPVTPVQIRVDRSRLCPARRTLLRRDLGAPIRCHPVASPNGPAAAANSAAAAKQTGQRERGRSPAWSSAAGCRWRNKADGPDVSVFEAAPWLSWSLSNGHSAGPSDTLYRGCRVPRKQARLRLQNGFKRSGIL